MKLVFTSKGTEWESMIDPRFGRAEYLLLYNDEIDEFTFFDNGSIAGVAHGAGPQTAQKLLELKPDVLITGNGPGGNAAAILERSNTKVYTGAGDMTVIQAFTAFKKGELTRF